jgi:hypothetical protein
LLPRESKVRRITFLFSAAKTEGKIARKKIRVDRRYLIRKKFDRSSSFK